LIDQQSLVREANELEPLHPSASRLARLLAQESWSLDAIVRVIAYDQVLAARLLRLANSVLYAAREPITTLDAAVMRLGPSTVLTLVMGTCIRQQLARGFPAYGISEGELWRHSVASALAAERARTFCATALPLDGFAAALLHDMGRMVLARCMTTDVLGLLARNADNQWTPALDAERDLLGTDHARLGAAIAEGWGLPPVIGAAIAHHHEPERVPVEDGREAALIAHVVHLADAVAIRIGEGLGSHERAADDLGPTLARLGLRPTGFDDLCQSVSVDLGALLSWYEQ